MKRGVRPAQIAAWAVAANVNDGISASPPAAPGSASVAIAAISPSVPLATGTQWAPVSAASRSRSSRQHGPLLENQRSEREHAR